MPVLALLVAACAAIAVGSVVYGAVPVAQPKLGRLAGIAARERWPLPRLVRPLGRLRPASRRLQQDLWLPQAHGREVGWTAADVAALRVALAPVAAAFRGSGLLGQ